MRYALLMNVVMLPSNGLESENARDDSDYRTESDSNLTENVHLWIVSRAITECEKGDASSNTAGRSRSNPTREQQ